ncbi:hypothetical protein NLG97_g6208 [Lecanicillium saksenae]|uniref:Uncharacterized protein n=1 Tax=Lecanicillium saksenae TaxID=468837 RepID=A0ACC1QTD9_9HYPO|nr:hypothetical protein NLG97_g6208 [Lecanicillium saksenae]
MASASASSDAAAPEQTIINLQIVSPSVGVNRPLQFPTTPATTTIKTLKGMIRDALPLRPADTNQRLIYRGKALLREEETLLEIMGAETLRTTDQHTIHLVLRDVDTPPAPTPTAPNNAPADGAPHVAQPAQPNVQPSVQPNVQPRMPSPAPLGQQLPPPAAAAFQQQHQQLTSWLNQRGRAQAGMRGVADVARDSSSRRGSPAPTHTIYRETHGPNGRSYHMETVIRNPAPAGAQNGAHSVVDIQNMVRNADSSQGSSALGAAMQRTASAASLPPRSAPSLLNMASAPQHGLQPRQGLELYLLSSPEGPRGILINNSTMETFYTPRNSTPAPAAAPTPYSQMTVREFLLSPPDDPALDQVFPDYFDEPNELRMRRQVDRFAPHRGQTPAQAPMGQPPVPGIPPQDRLNQNVAQPAVQPLHVGNPMAGLGQFLVRMMPHLWNIVRLGFFVWLFVGKNSSWTRWFVIISTAIFIFVLGTGALNGMGEHFWRPMVRHLESLFPTLDRPGQIQPAHNGQPGTDPNPAEMAARLVAERNERRPWLSEQMRRVERAGLLFLASIAPGVAERHIANLEEEARQEERRRREAEEAAAAAAREAERQANENGEHNQEDVTAEPSRQGASGAAIENDREGAPAREPLVAL